MQATTYIEMVETAENDKDDDDDDIFLRFLTNNFEIINKIHNSFLQYQPVLEKCDLWNLIHIRNISYCCVGTLGIHFFQYVLYISPNLFPSVFINIGVTVAPGQIPITLVLVSL